MADAPAAAVRAVSAAILVNLVAVLSLFLTGAMSVQIGASMGVSAVRVGMLASVFAAATVAGSAPLGRMVGRWGIRRNLTVSALVAATGGVLAALAANPWMLAGALLLAGFGNALGNRPATLWWPPRRGTAVRHRIRDQTVGDSLATTVAGLAVPLIALTVGWRWAYAASGVVAAAAVFIVPPDAPAVPGRSSRRSPRVRCGLWMLALGMTSAVVAASSIGSLGAAGRWRPDCHPLRQDSDRRGWRGGAGGAPGSRRQCGSVALRLLARRRALDRSGCGRVALDGCGGGAAGDAGIFVVGLVVANAFGWGWPGLLHLAVAGAFHRHRGRERGHDDGRRVGAGGGSDALGQRHLDGRVGVGLGDGGVGGTDRIGGRVPGIRATAASTAVGGRRARSTARVGHSGIPARNRCRGARRTRVRRRSPHPRRR